MKWTDRKLPIYFLIDCSDSMTGEPIDNVRQWVEVLLSQLTDDSQALEIARLSIITFNDSARQIVTPTKLMEFNMPQLETGGSCALGEALRFFKDCVKREVCNGDWKPILFMFINSQPSDKEIFNREVKDLENFSAEITLVYGSKIQREMPFLNQITDKLIPMNSLSPDFISKEPKTYYFDLPWMTRVLDSTFPIYEVSSNAVGNSVNLKKSESKVNLSKPSVKNSDIEKSKAVSNYQRRLPVYLLIDCSASMFGEPIVAVQQGIELLLSDLKCDPQALETVHLSVITFDNEARQIVPLTELMSFNLPELQAHGQTALGEALHVLKDCVAHEVRKNTAEHKGDWKPIIFLLTDGYPTDKDVFQNEVQDLDSLRAANIIACAAGARSDTTFLKQITNNVLMMNTVSQGDMMSFFAWASSSLSLMSDKISTGAPINLPAPPPGFTVVP